MGFLSGLSDKIAAARQHSKDKKELLDEIVRDAAKGNLTDLEMNEIHARYKQLGLSPDDLRGARADAYSAALHAAENDGVVTAEKEVALGKLQQFLMIPDSEITTQKKELARRRLLWEIQNGTPPAINVANLILQKGETPYWSESASLLEERVVNRRYEGGSQGMSFRIARGVYYRVGAQRGNLIVDKAVLPVSSGAFVITSKRVIFQGDAKSFALRLDKLLSLNLFRDGIRFSDDKGKPRMIKFADDSDSDVVGATLSYAINHFAN